MMKLVIVLTDIGYFGIRDCLKKEERTHTCSAVDIENNHFLKFLNIINLNIDCIIMY